MGTELPEPFWSATCLCLPMKKCQNKSRWDNKVHICSSDPTESHSGTSKGAKKVVDMEGSWGLGLKHRSETRVYYFFSPFYTGESQKRQFPMSHARDQKRNNILLYLLSYFDRGRFFLLEDSSSTEAYLPNCPHFEHISRKTGVHINCSSISGFRLIIIQQRLLIVQQETNICLSLGL